MNLFDPTGRMKAKRERQYASLRDMFQKNGVDTVQAAEAALVRMRNSMLVAAGVLLLVPLAVLVFSPTAAKTTALIVALLLIWLVATMTSARRHVRRYIAEELREREGDASASA